MDPSVPLLDHTPRGRDETGEKRGKEAAERVKNRAPKMAKRDRSSHIINMVYIH